MATPALDPQAAAALLKFASPATLAWHLTRGQPQAYRLLPHSVAIANACAEMTLGKYDRLMIFVPPQYGKSLTATIWHSIWRMSLFPHENIGIASYSEGLAIDWGRQIRNLINEHSAELGISISQDSASATRWHTTAGGTLEAHGIRGAFTGKGFHQLVFDDLIKDRKEADSEVIRKDAWSFYTDVARTRRRHGDAGKGKMLYIGTRWHEDDVPGRLKVQMEEGTGEHWHVLSLPALAEDDDPLKRSLGEALWEEKETAADLLITKRVMGEASFNALMQQRPSSPEGNRIKRDWWRYWKELPAEFDEWLQSWDFALLPEEENDYTVGQVWARLGAQFYLIDQIKARMTTPEALSAIRNMTTTYPRATRKLVEKTAMGPAVEALSRAHIPGIILVPVKGSKKSRVFIGADAVSPFIEAGNVFLPSPGRYPWVAEFVETWAAFPKVAHDDEVDAGSQALADMGRRAHGAIREAHKQAIEHGKPILTLQEEFNRKLQAMKYPPKRKGAANPYERVT